MLMKRVYDFREQALKAKQEALTCAEENKELKVKIEQVRTRGDVRNNLFVLAVSTRRQGIISTPIESVPRFVCPRHSTLSHQMVKDNKALSF